MRVLKSFLAGFLSTLVFHQGLLALLHGVGATPRMPWVLTPTRPFGVPAVVSLAFFGGLWGILIWEIVRKRPPSKQWAVALALGAVLPTLVALFVVFPMKGLPVAGGWKPDILLGALLLNGAWGVGVVVFMRLLRGA
jgi:hypothetical protein